MVKPMNTNKELVVAEPMKPLHVIFPTERMRMKQTPRKKIAVHRPKKIAEREKMPSSRKRIRTIEDEEDEVEQSPTKRMTRSVTREEGDSHEMDKKEKKKDKKEEGKKRRIQEEEGDEDEEKEEEEEQVHKPTKKDTHQKSRSSPKTKRLSPIKQKKEKEKMDKKEKKKKIQEGDEDEEKEEEQEQVHKPKRKEAQKKSSPYHWTVLVYDMQEQEWKHYNSLKPIKKKKLGDPYLKDATIVKDAVEKFMKELEERMSKQPQFNLLTPIKSIFKEGAQLRTVQEAPQQNIASVDCGPVVCYIIKKITELEEIPQKLEKEEVSAFRMHLIHKILHDEPRSWTEEKWQDKQLAHNLKSDK